MQFLLPSPCQALNLGSGPSTLCLKRPSGETQFSCWQLLVLPQTLTSGFRELNLKTFLASEPTLRSSSLPWLYYLHESLSEPQLLHQLGSEIGSHCRWELNTACLAEWLITVPTIMESYSKPTVVPLLIIPVLTHKPILEAGSADQLRISWEGLLPLTLCIVNLWAHVVDVCQWRVDARKLLTVIKHLGEEALCVLDGVKILMKVNEALTYSLTWENRIIQFFYSHL